MWSRAGGERRGGMASAAGRDGGAAGELLAGDMLDSLEDGLQRGKLALAPILPVLSQPALQIGGGKFKLPLDIRVGVPLAGLRPAALRVALLRPAGLGANRSLLLLDHCAIGGLNDGKVESARAHVLLHSA